VEHVDLPVEGIQCHGILRGEQVYIGGKYGTVWVLHDFIADDGTVFAIESRVTDQVGFALTETRSNAIKAKKK
jgi:hypothetical protein